VLQFFCVTLTVELTLKHVEKSLRFQLDTSTLFLFLRTLAEEIYSRCVSRNEQITWMYICAAQCNVIVLSRHANRRVTIINLEAARFKQSPLK